MIIANIYGGLGNQLFQYAAGKALADYHNVLLKIDTSFYASQKYRDFALDKFHTNYLIASPDDVRMVRNNGLLSKAYQRLLPVYKRSSLMEPCYFFYDGFFRGRSQAFISGLWQSEKYFNSINGVIRREFIVKSELVGHLKEKAEEIKNEVSVSVHIRRGDYLLAKALSALPKDYYDKALSLILQRAGDAKVYFFSDDIEWVKENIDISTPHEFISGTVAKSSIEDFYLMQHCRHNIIANSTFSWWAAWLNKNEEKIVVAPKTWFSHVDNNTHDLIPKEWYRV